MASKYLRGQNWWVKYRHPVSGELVRESLETGSEAQAELLRQRVDLEVALLEPRLQILIIPGRLRETLQLLPAPGTQMVPDIPTGIPATAPVMVTVGSVPSTPAQPATRTTVNDAVATYLRFVTADNAAHHVANKVSMLRRFLGAERVAELGGPPRSVRGVRENVSNQEPAFEGTYLDELGAVQVQNFIEGLGVSRKTMRHYRELFHHFFEVCLRFDLYRPTNWHRPNPVAALPSYLTRNRRITYLGETDVTRQLAACQNAPGLQMAVNLMIHAGLRRTEMLWLTRDSVAEDLSYLSVRNQHDGDSDLESSLKTGERTVTVLPPLREALERYLPTCAGRWLVPNARGERWQPDHFSKKLRTLNRDVGLGWNCLSFRHTYATRRANEGWSLFRIAKEMGNSAAVVEEYYAAFLRPEGSREQPRTPEPRALPPNPPVRPQ